ncbi:transmembrane protein, putative (macronuclear) [Tetrahymena thermophila SB210]|uniref:Transmembrane protein, putative n=1 Tax=Tetrahymena thermophila (strain SB210) TaxID=312017 RepID=Q245N3_TETTS|nr:transmembrane protein, putative [Tetrahymena thermophila SB210]EAS03600.2 transmembrane protein, putative [Tetrahymena thermophila SB210]|eukprot:XP_001023845.2 transmembrane protein, putative [Tetrahymena thermophila SB210]
MKHLQDSLSSQQQDTKLYVQKVFKMTEEKENIKKNIKQLLQKKIILYEAVINNKLQQQKESYLIALYSITNQISQLENRIRNLWKEDKGISTIRLVCFFLAEVKNDLYGAYIWSKQVFAEDPLEIRVNKQYNIDIKNDKVCRIYVDFGQNKAMINSFSQNASQILSIDQIKLQNVKLLSKLIPSPVSEIHDSLIKEFFLTGKSKNFRQLNMLQMKNLDNYSDPVQIFFDIDMTYTQDLRLVAFVKIVRNYSSVYLIFNSEGILESASSNIFNKFFISEDQEDKNFENSFLHNMSWNDLFPNLEMYKKTFESFENTKKKTQEYKWIQQPIEISKQRHKKQDQIYSYCANITIRQQVYCSSNQMQQQFYYVVEIENIKNQKNSEYTAKQAKELLKGNQQIGLYGLETMFSYTQDNFFSKDNLENIQEEEEGAEIQDSKMVKKNQSLIEIQEQENTMNTENAQNIYKQKVLHGINKLKLQRKMSDYRSNTEMSLSPEIKKDKLSQRQSSQLQLFDFSERGLQNKDSFMSPENKNKELRKMANRHNSYINSSRSGFMFDQNNQSSYSLTFFNELRGLDDQSTNHYNARQENSAKQLSNQIQVFSPSSYQNPYNNQINNNNSISQIYNNDDQQQSSRMNIQIPGDSFSITQEQNFYNLIKNYEQQHGNYFINLNNDLNNQLQTNRMLKEQKSSESDQEENEVQNDFQKMKSFKKKVKTIQTSLVSQQQFEREYMKRINHNNTSSNVKGKYMYFNNYKSMHEFTQSKKLPNSLKILSATNLMQIILSVIQVIGLTFYLRDSIFGLQHKLNLIQLQSQFLSPIDEGFGTLWKGFINMEDYFLGQLDGIPQSELDFYQNYFKLIRSNINYTYDRLQQFEYSMDNSQQDFIDFLGQVSEFRENDGNYGYNNFNSTNRFIVVQMLKTFSFLKTYDWENNYLDNKGYYYDYSFLQMNMLKITNIFSQLSQNLIQVLQKISQSSLISVNVYLIISSIILSLLIIVCFVYFIQFQAIKKSIFNLFHFNDAIWINLELQSTKEKLNQVNLDQNIDPFSDYHFNLYQYDEMLYIQEQTKEKMKSKFKSRKGINQSNKIEIPIPQFYSRKLLVLFFIMFLGVIISNALSISFIKKSFIDSYISSAEKFSYFQDSSNLASRLSGYIDLANAINIHWFSYFNQNDTILMRNEFDEKVILFRSFITNQVIQINDLGPFKNKEFIKFLNAANSYDLCSQIMHLDGIELEVCNIASGGILKQGLSASLIQFINDIKSDRDQTNFEKRSKQKLEVFEISLFCSRVLNYASDLLFKGIEDLCDSSWQYLLSIILIFGIFSIGANLIIMIYIKVKIKNQFFLLKQSLFLLPIQTISFERTFSTSLRLIYLKYDLYSNYSQV